MDAQEKQELLDAINANHDIAFKAYQALFENSVKSFSEQLGQFEERNANQHHEIMDHQKETNGRVTIIEKETSSIRWCLKHPKTFVVLVILLITGALTLGVMIGIDNLIKFIP